MIDIYEKQVRSILEFGVPVWNSNVTQQEVSDVEQVQKSFLHIVLDSDYTSYGIALNIANLESLEARRTKLYISFAVKAQKHPTHKNWFVTWTRY